MNALYHLITLQERVAGNRTEKDKDLFLLISLVLKATNTTAEISEEQSVILNDLIFDRGCYGLNFRLEAINIATWLNSCH